MPEIKNFEPRLYQETIFETAVKKNTLVVLPTGMGKTAISLMLTINRLKNFPNSKCLIVAPTKPLCNQHLKTFQKHTDLENQVILLTGAVPPIKRKELIQNSKIIIATPQTIESDIVNERINLEEISLLCFDEAHRAVQNYSYTWLAKQYKKKSSFPKILALTASPGSDASKIKEICKNLFIEDIEIRTEESPDVSPYIQQLDINWITISLPEEFKEIQNFLKECFKSKLERLKELSLINTINLTKKELINLQAQLHGKLAQGQRDISTLKGISLLAEAIKAEHALELLETQSISSLYQYMNKLKQEAEKTKVKATKNLVIDLNFRSAFIQAEKLLEKNIEHPKLTELKKIVKELIEKNPNIKIIVFSQYRDTASLIESELNKIPNIKAKLFVGQLKKGLTGLTQKEQIEIIEKFKANEYNVLCCTSVGEEGLDIPAVNSVIFFEPIPSAIRSIQRRGRTARLEKGSVTILITKNTRDEAYHWISYYKEKRMQKLLTTIKKNLNFEPEKESSLTHFIKEKQLKIFADSREKGNNVIKELINLNIKIETKNLDAADYIVSERIGIELKKVPDFVNSIIDKRLLSQIKNLRNAFEIPLLIIQGEEDIYSVRKVHPNAIRGMLTTIAVAYNIPIIYTKNDIDTAAFLKILAKQEQDTQEKDFGVRFDKKPLTTKEQQEFIIESLPGVGPLLAKSLLSNFKTVQKIINANEDELQNIEKLGPKKAKEISKIINEIYED